MKLDLFVTSTYKMVDNVGGRGVASGTAEPLAASEASDDSTRVMDTAVTTYESAALV
jgi:hypothetical protein